MGKAVQTLLVGVENVARTRATTMVNMRFVECTVNEKFVRIIPKEEGGVRVKDYVVKRGIDVVELTIKILFYYDWLGYYLYVAQGAPVTALATGVTTGAWTHKFFAGLTGLKSMSFDYYDGEGWREMLGAVVDSAQFDLVPEKLAEATFKILGPTAADIGAPTIPAITVATGMNHPIDVPQQSVTVNGSPYTKLQKLTITTKNNRAADYVVHTGTDPLEFDEGDCEMTFQIDSVYKGVAGSLWSNYQANTSPGPIAFMLRDTVNFIGTPTSMANPTVLFTIPQPGLTSVTRTKKAGRVIESAKGTALWDSATATNFEVDLTNTKSAYTPD